MKTNSSSYRMPFQAGITSIPNRQYPENFLAANKSRLPLQLNRPRSIYQYSSTAPRLSGKNCKFFKFLLSLNSQKRLGYKENNTKYRILTRKPRSHVQILIYRTWPISSTAESANAIATDFGAQFISVWIKPKFHIALSDNDDSSVEYFGTTARSTSRASSLQN